MGGKETKSNGINDYYNNIDYTERMSIEKSIN